MGTTTSGKTTILKITNIADSFHTVLMNFGMSTANAPTRNEMVPVTAPPMYSATLGTTEGMRSWPMNAQMKPRTMP